MKALKSIESSLERAKRHLDGMSTGNLSHHRNVCLNIISDILNILRLDGKEILSYQAKTIETDIYFKGYKDALEHILDQSYRLEDQELAERVVKEYITDIPRIKKIYSKQ